MLKNLWNKIIQNERNPYEEETTKRKMKKRINTLENENEILREVIKDELLKQFLEKVGEPKRIEKLKEENKNLRLKIKELKEEVKEKENGIQRKNSKITK